MLNPCITYLSANFLHHRTGISIVLPGKDICSLIVILSLDIGTYMWYGTHYLVMVHVPMQFHEIIFHYLGIVN